MRLRLPQVEIFCPADTCSDDLRRWMETEGAKLTDTVTFKTRISVLYVDKTTLDELLEELPGTVHNTRIVVIVVSGSLTREELRGYLAHTAIDHWFCGMPGKNEFISVLEQLRTIGLPVPAMELAFS